MKIIEWLKKSWAIWGGIVAGFINSFLLGFNTGKIQNWISVLMLILLWIGIFKVLFPVKLKKTLDTLTNNEAINALNFADNPTRKGEELGESIIYNIKGGHNIMKKIWEKLVSFFKWLIGNKKSLCAIVTNVVAVVAAEIAVFTGQLNSIDFLAEYDTAVKIAAIVLGILVSINNIYAIVTKYGLEKLSDIEARTAELKEAKLKKLTKAERKAITDKIKGFEEDLAYVKQQAEPFIKAYEMFQKYGKVMEPTNQRGYDTYLADKSVIEAKIANEKNSLNV